MIGMFDRQIVEHFKDSFQSEIESKLLEIDVIWWLSHGNFYATRDHIDL